MYQLLTESKEPIQTYTISGTIGDVPFDDEHIIKGSVALSNQCSSTSEFRLGGVFIGQLNISFVDINIPRNDWNGKEINITVHIGEHDIPLGIFTIDSAKHSKNIVAVVAYDNMMKFDKTSGTQQGTHGSAYDLLMLACERCNVLLGMTQAEIEQLPNGTQPLVLNEIGDIETWRDLIYWIAVSLGSFATIDRSGKLVLRTFHDSVDDTLNYDIRFASSTYGDEIIKYTGINIYVSEEKKVEYYHAETDDGYTLNIGQNPFFQVEQTQRQHYADALISALQNVRYNTCSAKVPFGFHYDLGDVLQFPNGQGSATNLFCIMGYSLKYNGECTLVGIPGQKQSMSKTDKNLQGILQTVGRNEFTSYELRNASDIVIASGESERLLQARIASNNATKAQIHIEVNLETEADEGEDVTKGIVSYLVNSQDVQFYPTETWIDGEHVLHLMYILPLEANSMQTFDVYMESNGGTISIDRGGVWLFASGAGLVGDGKWNGRVEIQEDAEGWTILSIPFGNVSESLLVVPSEPERVPCADTASEWNIISINFENVSDDCDANLKTTSFRRITEDGATRYTENDDVRYTEGD